MYMQAPFSTLRLDRVDVEAAPVEYQAAYMNMFGVGEADCVMSRTSYEHSGRTFARAVNSYRLIMGPAKAVNAQTFAIRTALESEVIAGLQASQNGLISRWIGMPLGGLRACYKGDARKDDDRGA